MHLRCRAPPLHSKKESSSPRLPLQFSLPQQHLRKSYWEDLSEEGRLLVLHSQDHQTGENHGVTSCYEWIVMPDSPRGCLGEAGTLPHASVSGERGLTVVPAGLPAPLLC